MTNLSPKPRRKKSFRERQLRLEAEAQSLVVRASSEKDLLDGMVRQSIRLHGA
jgi:hypothetical protein